jgi:hypothetical protein
MTKQYLEFRADAFNLFNHPTNSCCNDSGIDASGGRITSAIGFQTNVPDARIFQLSGKYVF